MWAFTPESAAQLDGGVMTEFTPAAIATLINLDSKIVVIIKKKLTCYLDVVINDHMEAVP
jgi:hypothetical protein